MKDVLDPRWSILLRLSGPLSQSRIITFLLAIGGSLVALKLRLVGEVELAMLVEDGPLLAGVILLAFSYIGLLLTQMIVWLASPPEVRNYPTLDAYLEMKRSRTKGASEFETSFDSHTSAWRDANKKIKRGVYYTFIVFFLIFHLFLGFSLFLFLRAVAPALHLSLRTVFGT